MIARAYACTACQGCADPFDDVIRACTPRLLLCKYSSDGVDSKRAALVDMAVW
jgi:hypothetical protein